MIMATDSKTLTNSEVIEKAWKLIGHRDVKSQLPARYTLRQLHEASLQMMQLGASFIDRYGDRLQELAGQAYRELKTWKEML